MSGTTSADVVVIGAGIVGAASAAHLAANGRRVLLLERSGIAAGASGRNSGVVQHPFDPVLVALHLETLERYRALAAVAGNGFALADRPVGLLYVGRDDAAARRLGHDLARSHPELDPTYLSPAEARHLEPALAADVSAVRVAIGYPVEPAAATQAYSDWAIDLGVEVRIENAARPWVVGGRSVGVVLDDRSRIGADQVLVAAGPWSPGLIDPTGAWQPIRPTWGVVVSITLAQAPTHVLEELEIDIEPDAADGDVDGEDLAFSLVPAQGASALGSTFLADEPAAEALVRSLVERGRRFVPGIADGRVGAHRVCARPQSRDGRPLLGPVPGIEGLWIAAGHGPWGISTGPASGRLVADLMVGREAAPPPAVDPARFEAPLGR